MQKGITLNKLAKQLTEYEKVKRDFMADSEAIRMKPDGRTLVIDGGDIENLSFDITKTAHRQIGKVLEIPAAYYDKCLENAPSLLAQSVNTWLHKENRTQMIRTFDYSDSPTEGVNTARAFLSKKYRTLDNVDILNNVLPIITDKGAEIRSSNVTSTHMYIHAAFPQVQGEIKTGDVVSSGVMIRNSDVGLSALKISPWIERLKCMNGMIAADSAVRKYHVGKAQTSSDLAYELMSDETKRKTDDAFWSQVRDVVRATIDEVQFQKICDQYKDKATEEVAEPTKAVEVITYKHKLSNEESKSMLQHLCEGGDYSTWGIANSVTRLAHDVKSYDRAVELEDIGGRVMEMNAKDWK